MALLFLLLFKPSFFLHPIHVSVSEVELSNTLITWTARIYKDDLLLGMYGPDITAADVEDEKKVEKDMLTFISRNVIVAVDGKNLKWSLKEIHADPEAIWVTVTSELKATGSLTVQNRILFDVYNDQKNIVNLTWDTGKKNMVFEKGDEKKVITL